MPQERRLTMMLLACLAYVTSCSGAYGLEPLIGAVGPGWAMVLILITPLMWSLPMALMVGELTTLLPEEGGFYVWVRESLGPFWGVQEAWWSMFNLVVLMASFPVLFVSYLTYFLPELGPAMDGGHPGIGALIRWLVAVLVIVSAMWLNLRGARKVGGSAKFVTTFVLGAFALMVVAWFRQGGTPGAAVGIVTGDLTSSHKGVLLLGLSYAIFNYSGWDGVSTYAGEVDQPQRNYPRAIAFALLLVMLSYVLPVLAGISATRDPTIWSADQGWPVIARMIGGRWLGALLAGGGLISMWGLFNGNLLCISRLPFAMARDGWLPKSLANASAETAVPKLAVVCFGGISAVFAALSFGSLILIQGILVAAGLLLELLALIVLRVQRPDAPRAFRVPGGWWGLGYVCVAPFAFGGVVLFAILRDWRTFPGQLLVVGGVAISGVALYFLRRRVALVDGGKQR